MSGVDAVAGGLRARRAEIEQAIFAHVREAVPDAVGDSDVEYVLGLRAAVAASVEFVLAGTEQASERGAAYLAAVPQAAVEQARRAVRSGVGLDTVLRRYMAGYTLLGDFAAQEAEGARTARGLRQLFGAQASSLDRLTAAVADEYACELDRAARSPARRQLELVQGLLAGGAPRDAGAELGYELEGWHLGAIATGADAGATVASLRAALGCTLLSVARGERTVWAWFGGGRRKVERAELAHVARASGVGETSVALGEPGHGLEGWRLTHRQAQAALVVALRRPRGLTRYADVALLAAALRDEALARGLLDTYLAPLAQSRDGGSALRQTLQAYFAAGRNVSSAAAALGVARSTVESRLHAIEERLGRPLHLSGAELEVALHLDALAR